VSQIPTFIEEIQLRERGYRLIAGIDEAGRGPLAGPVVAAAVVLYPEAEHSWYRLLRDSKQLTPQKREFLFDCIRNDEIPFGVGIIHHEFIDEQGIATATVLAMRQAVETLPALPDFLLIDYVRLRGMQMPQKSITRGDSHSLSIAAASIVAKVTRDRLMVDLDGQYPGYGLARNKGYGSQEHIECLRNLGPCAIHRRSFAPVREVLNHKNGEYSQPLL